MKLGPFALRMTRLWLRRSDKKNYANVQLPEGATETVNVDALGDGIYAHQIDVFHPAKEKRIGKTLLDIHGGGYIYGTRHNNKMFAGVFLEKGFDVITLDYPLNGKKGRDCLLQIRIVARQLRFIYDNAESLGVNRDALYLTGDSAGGHLALLLAEMVCDPALAAKIGADLTGIALKAVAPSCPVYDFVRLVRENQMLSKRGKKFMFGKTSRDEGYAELLCPRLHLPSLTIPLFLSSCKRDFLLQESLDLNADLEKTDIPHQFIYVDSDDPAIAHIHNVLHIKHPESIRVNDAMESFFLAHAE